MTKKTHEYSIDDIREVFITIISSDYYGQRYQAERQLEDIERVVKNIDFDDALMRDFYVFCDGIGGCAWVMEKYKELDGDKAKVKLSHPLPDVHLRGGYVSEEVDFYKLAQDMKAHFDALVAQRRKAELDAAREKRMKNQASNRRHLRDFVKKPPRGPGR